MNLFVHGRLGHFLMNEAPADGAPGDGAAPATEPAPPAAPADPAAPASPPAQQPAPATGHESLLTDPADDPAVDPAKPDDQPAAPQAPEAYKFESLPEGYTLDEAAAAEWSTTFKELGLSQESVDKLVAADAKRQQGVVDAMQAQFAEAHKQQVGEWIAQVKADPEIGGAKFAENVEIARSAIKAYGSPELSKLLKETGLGSHPALLKAFHKAGLELGEGRLHRTTTEVPGDKPIANRMYPNLA
ncbi:peptidase [Pseudomonas tructae]|uniref:Peptidase n=1 Tax=Pseudomonas tructae TaxID=2518644 RepID=A0A411MK48_9PSED|nr:peptidase [Pseudomonas tructae]QBF27161.1 peptidase [Pseudomonas tructae]